MYAAVPSKKPATEAHHNNTTLARWKSAGNRAKDMGTFIDRLEHGFAKPSNGIQTAARP
jgi:hypothetical protein